MMRPLSDQVVVITGASSGIGRESAIELGRRGASLVLSARGEAALEDIRAELAAQSVEALAVATDVADRDQVNRLRDAAIERFGRIDTWINNAGVYYVGPIEKMTTAEFERVMQVNLMGQVNGVMAVLPQFIAQGSGAFINVSSGLSVLSAPMLGAYSASKHAVHGFTESLRLELARNHPDISVTEILPASINTPLFRHARNKLGAKTRPLPPVYRTGEVARAIVYAAEHPRRDIYIGPLRLFAAAGRLTPGFVDRSMLAGDAAVNAIVTDEPGAGTDNIFAPMPPQTYAAQGEWGKETMPLSLSLRTGELHPWMRGVFKGAFAIGGVFAMRRMAGRLS
jgi:short-subunit dehydrogenase